MTEQKIENLICVKLQKTFEEHSIDDYQIISVWSPAETLKAVESKAGKIITVSV